MPLVLTPAADGAIAGCDVLPVRDGPRATAFRCIGHLVPQLLHFLIFWMPCTFGTARCPLCFAKTSLALIAESVQLLLECG